MDSQNLIQKFIQSISKKEKPSIIREILQQILQEITSTEEKRTEFFNNELIKNLITTLTMKPNNIPILSLDILGEFAKDDEIRQIIISDELLNTLFPLLSKKNLDFQRLTLRLLANLCFDNFKNSELIFQKGGLEKPLQILSSLSIKDNSEFIRICIGFFLNISNENEDIQTEIGKKKGLQYITPFINSIDNQQLLLVTLRTINNLIEVEENRKILSDLDSVIPLFKLLTNSTGEIQEISYEILSIITIEEKCRTLIIKEKLVLPLIQLINLENFDENQKNLFRILTYLALNDDAMEIMLNNNVIDLVTKLIYSEDSEISLSAAMWMANLARTDSVCMKLMERTVLIPLEKFLRNKDFRIQHLAAGTIRNLTLPEQTRNLFVHFPEIMKLLIKLLDTDRAEVQNYCVSALHFLSSVPEISKFIVENEGFQPLMKLSKNESLKRSMFSSVRVLYNLVLNTEDPELLCDFIQKEIFSSIILLISSEHKILQMEGLKMLLHLTEKEKPKNCLIKVGFDLKPFLHLLDSLDNEIIECFLKSIKNLLKSSQIESLLNFLFGKIQELSTNLSLSFQVQQLAQECLKIFPKKK
ncbi:rap1 gtpase-gdp dissociation stimulator 1 [Anaeramoeba ignava]|uniref:Rap1 gtpase-gdp dissociation stimulator 1 n=1 Tax=Anaeramoeba ignava TaxID=1746090 RepID=A0A9Q0LJS5_ANAIG|nr:rap1 gtpase-gdp dissociation stimulator 1 [Anaeramoeba ignava]